ncbi:MAG: helix-turn-helix transcriptional regulator [Bacteroidota bacterium]
MAQKNSKNLSFIGENIKKIRTAKNISQAEFASLFNLARPSVGAYEEGRSEPKIETIIHIANHFRLSIDVLLTRELTVNDIYSFGLVNEKLNKAHQFKKQPKSLLPDPIALVGIQDYVNYIVQYKNGDFISDLPRISVPDGNIRSMRAFEMNGSEMEYHQQGIHHGDLLICKRVELEGLPKLEGALLTLITPESIVTRRLLLIDNGMQLTTDDPNYEPTEIQSDQILECWRVIAVYSKYLNPPTLLEERVMKLEREIEKLKQA